MNDEEGKNDGEQNRSRGDSGRFATLWRLGALIQLGNMPFGSAAGPLALWLFVNEPGPISRKRKEEER